MSGSSNFDSFRDGWPYSCCFVGCCHHDLFNIALSILVWLPSSFFSIRLVSVDIVHPYSSIDTTATWKKQRFILSVRSDFHMTDSLSIAVHALKIAIETQKSEYKEIPNPNDLKFISIKAGSLYPAKKLSKQIDNLSQLFLHKLKSYIRNDILLLDSILQKKKNWSQLWPNWYHQPIYYCPLLITKIVYLILNRNLRRNITPKI